MLEFMCKFTQDLMMSFGRAMRDFALPPPPSVPLPSSPPLQNKNHHCTGKTHSLQKTTAIRISSPFPTFFVLQSMTSDEVDFSTFIIWVSKSSNLQNCIKTCFNYFFSFSQFISSLSKIYFGSARIQMFTPQIAYCT